MRTTRLGAAGVLAAALVLTACSGGGGSEASTSAGGEGGTDSGEKVELTLTWWGNDDRAERYEEAVSLFEEEHPNITVIRTFQSWNDYWTARNTEAAGRALPDVMQTDIGYISQYGNQGLFLDLTPYVGGVIDTSEYPEALLQSGTADGALVGLPVSTTALAIQVNEDLLDELGVPHPSSNMTWETFQDYILTVNAAGADRSPAVYATGDYTNGFATFMLRLAQEGKEVFTPEGTAAFTQGDVIDWLDSVETLRAEGAFFPSQRAVALTPLTPFTAGETGLAMEWATMVANSIADLGTENIGLVPPPYGSDTTNRGLAEKPGMLMSAAANTKHPEEAAVLVNFLANDPQVAQIFGTSRGVPATATARAAVDAGPADKITMAYLESIADDLTASYPPLPSGYGPIEAKWLELHEELSFGNITAQEFATSLFAEMDLTLGT